MLEIVIASKNDGKIREIKDILSDLPVKLLTYREFKDFPKLYEEGETFKENAISKAKTLRDALGVSVLSDDSGLEVDFLGGAPGVYSSRYAGKDATDKENNEKLLRELEGVPWEKRKARYRCVAVFLSENGELLVGEGVCEGYIGFEPKGNFGFGYDPLFIPLGYDKTMAELRLEEKNKISHRGKAFRKMKKLLQNFIKDVS